MNIPSGKSILRYVLALAALLQCSVTWATDCVPDNITLTTQSAVDLFQNHHGPNCDTIVGNLLIGGDSDHQNSSITHLNGLSRIKSVQGQLTISYNLALTNVSGLGSLQHVGRNLGIFYNREIKHLSGLSALQRVGGTLEISANRYLERISGLSGLIQVDGSLRIRQHQYLGNLDGLENLQSIGDNLILDWLVSINDLSAISQIEALPGDLRIRGSSHLRDVDDFSNLESIGGNLEIDSNRRLANLDGFSSLTRVGGLVEIEYNYDLENCSGLNKLLDIVDHGVPGPAPAAAQAPDVGLSVTLIGNSPACDAIGEIAPRPVVEKVLTGSWYAPESAGEGFMLHAVEEHVREIYTTKVTGLAIGYFYGFDAEGNRYWLIGTHDGDMEWGAPIVFDAVAITGGQFDPYNFQDVEQYYWGSFSVEPWNCEQATIRMDGQFSGAEAPSEKTLLVSRLGGVFGGYCSPDVPANEWQAITGSWWDPATSGQGLAFHAINDESGIVYFYGFDQARKPLWLIGLWDQPWEAGQTKEIEMLKVSGGNFDALDPSEISEQVWGVGEFKLNDCNSGSVILRGTDGEQQLSLTQLAGSVGLECGAD